MMMDDQSISQKQAELYQTALAAFVRESRKSTAEIKARYQKYVDKHFAKLSSDNGAYILSQSGQKSVSIPRGSNLVSKGIKVR